MAVTTGIRRRWNGVVGPSRLDRWSYRADLPVTVALLAWCWLGRVLFGLVSWWVLVFPLTLGLLMGLCLAYTLSITRAPEHPRWFTRDERNAHLGLWIALALFGFAAVDAGTSPFARLFGDAPRWIGQSWVMVGVAGLVGVVAWLAVLVLGSGALGESAD